MKADLYYRGCLSSCNYDCPYCPFGKTKDSPATLAKDREGLETFVRWVASRGPRPPPVYLFQSVWRGLTHRWYREAMITLSHLEHVDKVAIQTNLSARLGFTAT